MHTLKDSSQIIFSQTKLKLKTNISFSRIKKNKYTL